MTRGIKSRRSRSSWRVIARAAARSSRGRRSSDGVLTSTASCRSPVRPRRRPTSARQTDRLHRRGLAAIIKHARRSSRPRTTSITANAIDGHAQVARRPVRAVLRPEALPALQGGDPGRVRRHRRDARPSRTARRSSSRRSRARPPTKAGIKAGDEILDDRRGHEAGVDERRGRLARPRQGGHEGHAHHPAQGRARTSMTFTITRAKIETPNVMTEMVGNGRRLHPPVQLQREGRRATSANAIAQLDKKGAKGYVLDLRENPGGLLDVRRRRRVAVRQGRRRSSASTSAASRRRSTTRRATSVTDKPLVVLVERGLRLGGRDRSPARCRTTSARRSSARRRSARAACRRCATAHERRRGQVHHRALPDAEQARHRREGPHARRASSRWTRSKQADEKTDTQFQKAVAAAAARSCE